MIVFVRSVDKYSSVDCASSEQANAVFDQCSGVSESTDWPIQSECGNENSFNSTCLLHVPERTHSQGWNSANCDFNANLRNIFYRCIPSKLRAFFSFSVDFQ
jgi:hypothetical protein